MMLFNPVSAQMQQKLKKPATALDSFLCRFGKYQNGHLSVDLHQLNKIFKANVIRYLYTGMNSFSE